MIKLYNISKHYYIDNNKILVLKDLNLTINAGEFVAIMGKSGSGKSTLLNIISFMDGKFEGKYLFKDILIENKSDTYLSKLRNTSVGYVFQKFNLIDTLNIKENIELPYLYSKRETKGLNEKIKNITDLLGISEQLYKYPNQLSGGQLQRAAIARALINDPEFLVADEPTGSLDSETSTEIMEIFKKLNKENNITIIIVTHDKIVADYCDRIEFLNDGKFERNF